MTIEVEISDQLLRKYGMERLVSRLEQQIKVDELRVSAEAIQTAIHEANLDHDVLFEEARTQAWAAYKTQHLSHILP